MEKFRTKTCLKIAIEWEAFGTSPELATEKGIVDLFSSNAATTEEVEAHCAAVWSVEDLVHAEFKIFLFVLRVNQTIYKLWIPLEIGII